MTEAPIGSSRDVPTLPKKKRRFSGRRLLRALLDLKLWVPALAAAGIAVAAAFVFLLVGLAGFYGAAWLHNYKAFLVTAVIGLAAGLVVGWTRRYHPRAAARIFTWKAWGSVIVGSLATYWGIVFLIGLGRLHVYRLAFAESQVAPILSGFYTSLEVVAVIIPLGFGLGFLVGWARTTKSLILRGLAAYYVDFFRSMPPIALIFFASLIGALSLKGSGIDSFTVYHITLWLGVVALGFHTAAYQAEIIRAGILSVPAGQTEAADAVGISKIRSMFVVVLPQAFRISLPPLGNEFSSVIKDTSLLSVIGWFELSGVGFTLVSESYSVYLWGSVVIWIEVAMLYFVLTYLVTRTVRVIEDLFKVPGLEVARL